MEKSFEYYGCQFIFDCEDLPRVKELLLKKENTARKKKFCSQGLRVQHDEKIKTLAAFIKPHKKNEVVRPVDGNWFNLKKANLIALKP